MTTLVMMMLAFLAGGGLYGGISLIRTPDGSGLGLSTTLLSRLPLADFRLPGFAILTLFGILPIFTLALVTRGGRPAFQAVRIQSLLLIGWMFGQIALIGYHADIQGVLTVLGVVMLLLSPFAAGRTPPESRSRPQE